MHSESCTLVVMGPSGKRLRQQVLDTHAKTLIDFLKAVAGGKYLCFEEGQLAEWLVEVLAPHVKEIVIVQPKKHAGRKSDADDAWALAEQIRVKAQGTYVFKPISQYRPLREAVRTHRVAVRVMTRAKNRLRSLFRSRGVTKLDKTLYDPEQRPKWIAKLSTPYRRREEMLRREAFPNGAGARHRQSRSGGGSERLGFGCDSDRVDSAAQRPQRNGMGRLVKLIWSEIYRSGMAGREARRSSSTGFLRRSQ